VVRVFPQTARDGIESGWASDNVAKGQFVSTRFGGDLSRNKEITDQFVFVGLK
jgi:hypothetical protein